MKPNQVTKHKKIARARTHPQIDKTKINTTEKGDDSSCLVSETGAQTVRIQEKGRRSYSEDEEVYEAGSKPQNRRPLPQELELPMSQEARAKARRGKILFADGSSTEEKREDGEAEDKGVVEEKDLTPGKQ